MVRDYGENVQTHRVTYFISVMSEAALHGFLRAIKEDPTLQAQVQAKDADPLAIAKSKGFDVDQAVLGRFCVRVIGAADHLVQSHPNLDGDTQDKLKQILSGNL